MMKLLKYTMIVTFALLSGAVPAAAGGLHITATLPALAQIAQGVAGDAAEVAVLAHVDQDPHFVPPKPTLARHLADADLLILAGLDLEIGWLPPLIEASRNDRIRAGSPGYIDGSQVLPDVLGKPQGKITRALGDIHPQGNPHWWMDPQNGVRLAYLLAEKLARLDPAHAASFRQNAKQFDADVQSHMPGWQQSFQAMGPLVSYHDSYLYLIQRFALHEVDFVEPKPGIEPSTAHLDALTEKLQQGAAQSVWLEPYHDGKVAQKVCSLGHVPCRIMPDAVSGDGFAAYLHLFDLLSSGGA